MNTEILAVIKSLSFDKQVIDGIIEQAEQSLKDKSINDIGMLLGDLSSIADPKDYPKIKQVMNHIISRIHPNCKIG